MFFKLNRPLPGRRDGPRLGIGDLPDGGGRLTRRELRLRPEHGGGRQRERHQLLHVGAIPAERKH